MGQNKKIKHQHWTLDHSQIPNKFWQTWIFYWYISWWSSWQILAGEGRKIDVGWPDLCLHSFCLLRFNKPYRFRVRYPKPARFPTKNMLMCGQPFMQTIMKAAHSQLFEGDNLLICLVSFIRTHWKVSEITIIILWNMEIVDKHLYLWQ